MIRPAAGSDLEHILDILRQSVPLMQQSGNNQWDSGYPNREQFRRDILENALYVYEADRAVAGFICLNDEVPREYEALPFHPCGRVKVLHRMAVLPEYRGHGIARQLVEYCERQARKAGCDAVWTDTNSKNLPVNTLLIKLDYRFVGHITLRENPDLFNCYEKLL